MLWRDHMAFELPKAFRRYESTPTLHSRGRRAVSTHYGWGAGELDGSFEALEEGEAYGATGPASYEQETYGQQESAYGGQYAEVAEEAEGVFDETEEMELAADLL